MTIVAGPCQRADNPRRVGRSRGGRAFIATRWPIQRACGGVPRAVAERREIAMPNGDAQSHFMSTFCGAAWGLAQRVCSSRARCSYSFVIRGDFRRSDRFRSSDTDMMKAPATTNAASPPNTPPRGIHTYMATSGATRTASIPARIARLSPQRAMTSRGSDRPSPLCNM